MKQKGELNIVFIIYISDPQQCVEGNIVIRSIVAMLPAYFRFAQCLRRYRDTKEAFPHLANAGKRLIYK